MPNPEAGSSFTSNKREEKYVISFTDIMDIEIKLDPVLNPASLHKEERELRRQSTRLFLRGGQDCIIDTYDSDHLARAITASWQSSLIRNSACIGSLLGNEDCALATSYYEETVSCLKTVASEAEVVELLEEFSNEVRNDLELKEVVFRSRELLMTSMNCVHDLLAQQPVFSSDAIALSSKQYSEKLPFSEAAMQHRLKLRRDTGQKQKDSNRHRSTLPEVGGVRESKDNASSLILAGSLGTSKELKLSVDQQQQLMIIVAHRLNMIHSFLKMLCAVFFCSESVTTRLSVLLGPSPLDLDCWLQFLVPDLCQQMCSVLGCPETTFQDEVDLDIQMSLEDAHNRRNGSFAILFPDEIPVSGPHSESTPRRMSRAPSMAKLITTPRGDKTKAIAGTPYVNEYCAAMKQLPIVRQSIRDLQAVLTFELFRIHSLAKCMGNVVHNAAKADVIVLDHVRMAVRLKESCTLGEVFTKQSNWEDTLELLVVRISTLLDDMLGSEHLARSHKAHGTSDFESSISAVDKAPYSQKNPLAMPPSPLPSAMSRSSLLLNNRLTVNSSKNYTSLSSLGGSNHGSSPNLLTLASPALLGKKLFVGDSLDFSAADAGGLLPLSSGRRSKVLAEGGSVFFPEDPSRSMSLGIADHRNSHTDLHRNSHSDHRNSHSELHRNSQPEHRNSHSELHRISFSHTHPPHSTVEPNSVFKSSTIQTQEILLFYLTSLIRALARDSSRVRETLLRDLGIYWKAIMGILNIVCPRPPVEKLRRNKLRRILKESSKILKPAVVASNSSSSRSSGVGIAGRSGRVDGSAAEEEKPMSKKKGKLHKLIKMFSGGGSAGGDINRPSGIRRSNSDDDNNTSSTSGNGKDNEVTFNTKQAMRILKNNSKEDHSESLQGDASKNENIPIDVVYAFEFGAPKYGLSPASWALLVQSRKAVEEIAMLLNLKTNLYNQVDKSVLVKDTPLHQSEDKAFARDKHSNSLLRKHQHTASADKIMQLQQQQQHADSQNVASKLQLLSIQVPEDDVSESGSQLTGGEGYSPLLSPSSNSNTRLQSNPLDHTPIVDRVKDGGKSDPLFLPDRADSPVLNARKRL